MAVRGGRVVRLENAVVGEIGAAVAVRGDRSVQIEDAMVEEIEAVTARAPERGTELFGIGRDGFPLPRASPPVEAEYAGTCRPWTPA